MTEPKVELFLCFIESVNLFPCNLSHPLQCNKSNLISKEAGYAAVGNGRYALGGFPPWSNDQENVLTEVQRNP